MAAEIAELRAWAEPASSGISAPASPVALPSNGLEAHDVHIFDLHIDTKIPVRRACQARVTQAIAIKTSGEDVARY